MPDWDNTESRESDEDAAWRELVARLEEPAATTGPVPWPEREDVARPRPPDDRGQQGPGGSGQQGPGGSPGPDAPGAFEPGAFEPDVIQGARPERRAAHGTRAHRIRARKAPAPAVPEDDEGHFVPPAPPPLPKLDPVAKGAWAALFGGPGYLVVATAAGWSVPGIAAFCAVAAFVTGFAILVLRMNDPGPGGPDDGDDGAVV